MTERTPPPPRSWLDVRWRQLRNPPPPVTRAILANLGVAAVAGGLLFALVRLQPQADLTAFVIAYVAVVLVAGSVLTYLWVELPTGASRVRRRSGWAAMLGLFAAVPIAYLSLVVIFHVLGGV